MAILRVRNVPIELYARLQSRAETQHRSLGSGVIAVLEWALNEADRTAEEPLASIRQRRRFNPASPAPPIA